jgi:hypothetical protein
MQPAIPGSRAAAVGIPSRGNDGGSSKWGCAMQRLEQRNMQQM